MSGAAIRGGVVGDCKIKVRDEDAPRREDATGVVISKRLVAVNAASSVVAQILNVGALLWMLQYLLTRIPPEEFAVYPVVSAIMVFAPFFFSFLTGGIARYIVEAYARGEKRRATEIVSSIVPLLSAFSFAFLSAGLTFAWFIDDILNIPAHMVDSARIMMALLIANFFLRMLLLPFTFGYQVRQRYVELNMLGVARDVVRIALLFSFLTMIGPEVLWVVVATVIAEATHITIVTVRSMQMTPELRFRLDHFQRGVAGSLLSFGFWTTVGQMANVLFTHAVTLLLNIHGTALDVTNYHLGAMCFRQLQLMIGLAIYPLQPALVAMYAQHDIPRLARTALRGGRYGLWVSLAVATPLAILSDEFVDLYLGGTFSNAAIVIIVFMAIFPFTQPTALLPAIAVAMVKVRNFNFATLVSRLIGVALIAAALILAEPGAVGVTLILAGVTIVAQVAYFWGLQSRFLKIARGPFARLTLLSGVLPAAAASAILLPLKFLIEIDGWGELILVGGAGTVVYLAVLLLFCLDPQDREMLRQITARFRRR